MDLDAFLAAQEGRGRLDSQGAFTVDVEKAREKLGRFALERPGLYLLKVVQAAVAMGATRVDVATTARGLGLWFDGDESSFADFRAAVASPACRVSEPLRLLADGFNASLWTGVTSACVIAWKGSEGEGLFMSEEGLVSGGAPPRPDGLLEAANVWMFSLSKSSRGWTRREVEDELSALRERCAYVPLELTLDGEKLLRRPPPSPSGWLVERLDFARDGGLRLELPEQRERRMGESGWLSGTAGETFCLQPAVYMAARTANCRAAYFLPLELSGKDRVAFVRHGVVVATHPLDTLGAGALAVVDASDLTVDLSGFGLVRDERLKLSVEKVRYVWREMAHSLNGPDLDHLPGERTLSALLPPALTASLGAVLLPLAPSPLALVGVVGLLGAVYRRAASYSAETLSTERHRAQTRRRLTALLDRQWPWSGSGS